MTSAAETASKGRVVPYEVIRRKRDGGRLTRDEIRGFVEGYLAGEIPDYQMAAFLMAVFFRKLDAEETAALTQVMAASGRMMDLSSVPGPTMDKHSTGGVGDKVSLPLAPLTAACGGFVPMMSGRGLGHTGGTLDKLESIPGFTTALDEDRFVEVVSRVGCAIIGQTSDVAPADKRMYALRDVTATVDTMDLIAASILSKKLAAGPESLVLDVKTGSGAFMRKREDAEGLARLMVGILHAAGRRGQALITNMDCPLGVWAGNAVEVAESIEVLKGGGPEDLVEITLELGARMLVLGGLAKDLDEGRRALEKARADGSGLARLRRMVEAQGGDPRVVDDPDDVLPKAPHETALEADSGGVVEAIDTYEAGMANVVLGAGRLKAEDEVDPAVGIAFLKKPGDEVERGEPLAMIRYRDADRLAECKSRLAKAIRVGPGPARTMPLILGEVLEGDTAALCDGTAALCDGTAALCDGTAALEGGA